MLYRRYRADDFAELYGIEQLCFEAPFRFSRELMRRLVSARRSATWLALEEDAMAGFIVVTWAPERPGLVAYIQTIEVLPQFRGRGIARELMRRAEASAREAGAGWIWLHVAAENLPAIGLYEKCGYTLRGRQENFYPRGGAALVYAKPLAL